MKKFFLIGFILLLAAAQLRASGVCIVDAYQGIYFRLLSNQVSVMVNDQIATVKTTQEFRNLTGSDKVIKYTKQGKRVKSDL